MEPFRLFHSLLAQDRKPLASWFAQLTTVVRSWTLSLSRFQINDVTLYYYTKLYINGLVQDCIHYHQIMREWVNDKLPFFSRHFQINSFDWKLLYCHSNFIQIGLHRTISQNLLGNWHCAEQVTSQNLNQMHIVDTSLGLCELIFIPLGCSLKIFLISLPSC